MGILDNKSRIVDTVLTWEGRQQLAAGRLGFVYYSFTDDEIVYKSGSVGVIDDASARFYFEAPQALPHDQISFRADDSGFLQGFLGSSVRIDGSGVILTSSLEFSSSSYVQLSGTFEPYVPVSGTLFSSLAETLLSGAIENFSRLSLIRTTNLYFDGEVPITFSTGNEIEFEELSAVPKNQGPLNINNLSLLGDRRFSSAKNFKFLPPLTNAGSPLGQWNKVGAQKNSLDTPITWSELEKSGTLGANYNGLIKSELNGALKRVVFDNSPNDAKLSLQIFELDSKGKVLKLDVFDAGEFETNDPSHPLAKVFFAGKVYTNSKNLPCFLNIFTLVFR